MTIILSAPRSDSTYVWGLLRHSGLDVGHEKPGPDGMVGFPFDMVANSGWFGCVPSVELKPRDDGLSTWLSGQLKSPLWWLVRNPYSTIASMRASFPIVEPWFRSKFDIYGGPTWPQVWLRVYQEADPGRLFHVEDIDDPATGVYERLCGVFGATPKAELPFRRDEHSVRTQVVKPYPATEWGDFAPAVLELYEKLRG